MSKTFRIGTVEVPINTEQCTHIPDELIYVLDDDDKGFAEVVLEAVNQSEPVLLVGPTGCGKTATLRYLASKTQNGYRRMQLNGATNLDNFVGRQLINAQGTYWQDGILTTAMRQGHWLVLDELNMALPEIAAILNAVMDDDKQLTLEEKDNEVVKPHPNFRLFACINPSEDYAGTKEMNRALVDRFTIQLTVDYPKAALEEKIIYAHTKLNKKLGKVGNRKPYVKRMVEFANAIRKKNKQDEMIFHCSTRSLINWSKFILGLGVKTAAKYTILNKSDEEDQKKMADELNKLFRDDEDKSMDELIKEAKESEEKSKSVKEGKVDSEVVEAPDVVSEPVEAEDVDENDTEVPF